MRRARGIVLLLALVMLGWQESDRSIVSCTNSGKGGSRTEPANCMCFMPCAKQAGSTDPNETEHDKRCKTYCRANDCKCKPPCV